MVTDPHSIRDVLREAASEAPDGQVQFRSWVWVDAAGQRRSGFIEETDALQVQITKRGEILTLAIPARDSELIAHMQTLGIG